MTPDTLKGKQLEKLLISRSDKLERDGLLTMGRYGVQASIHADAKGNRITTAIESYPDLEGVIAPIGKQFIIEAKVCSAASFSLSDKTHFRDRQLKHLLTRADFGAACYLMIHFNRRELKTRTDEAFTVALEVHRDTALWSQFLRSEVKSFSRDDIGLHGVPVEWNLYSARDRIATPDLARLLGLGDQTVGKW